MMIHVVFCVYVICPLKNVPKGFAYKSGKIRYQRTFLEKA